MWHCDFFCIYSFVFTFKKMYPLFEEIKCFHIVCSVSAVQQLSGVHKITIFAFTLNEATEIFSFQCNFFINRIYNK